MSDYPTLVLLAHGSRDPAWSDAIEGIAAELRLLGRDVHCAYLEHSKPDLFTLLRSLKANVAQDSDLAEESHLSEDLEDLRLRGADSASISPAAYTKHHTTVKQIQIVPLFLGLGNHVRQDLPQLLATARAEFSDWGINMSLTLCDNPRFSAMMVQLLATLDAAVSPSQDASTL